MDGSEKDIPDSAALLSDNGISKVWRFYDGYIYKRSTPFLVENEIYFLKLLEHTGYVPRFVSRHDKYTVKMEDLGNSESVTDRYILEGHIQAILYEFGKFGVIHGDLTRFAIIVKSNKPYVIDFSESRLVCENRPSKRKEEDHILARRTIDELCKR